MSCSEGCDKKAKAAAKVKKPKKNIFKVKFIFLRNVMGTKPAWRRSKKFGENAAELVNAKLDATKKLQPPKKNVRIFMKNFDFFLIFNTLFAG